MKELKVGERVTTTLKVVEQGDSWEGCFFADKEGCPYQCFKDMRSDGKDVIFKIKRYKDSNNIREASNSLGNFKIKHFILSVLASHFKHI